MLMAAGWSSVTSIGAPGAAQTYERGINPPGDSTRALAAEQDVSGDKAVLVMAEPNGGSSAPTSAPILSASLT